jgi:hypothetical protein
MRPGVWLPLILGCLLSFFSRADAKLSWPGDYFNYTVKDQGGIYYDSSGGAPVLLGASMNKSQANGDSENTAVATANESETGLCMASGAWGNSFQDSVQDTGGATVYGYAENCCSLDSPLGVAHNGQNVSSFIDRPFTVSATGKYTISASAIEPLDWSGTTTGSAAAPKPTFTGQVQIFQTDPQKNTTTLLDGAKFSLPSLAASPQQVTLTLLAGDSYQLVVALSGVTSVGGPGGQPGIATSFNNLDQNSLSWLGKIEGNFNAGAENNPVTITASLSPAITPSPPPGPSPWQNAKDLGNGWKWLKWFGYFNTLHSPWIYHLKLGWFYLYQTSAQGFWFWDGRNGFCWTSQTAYPYVYRYSSGSWVHY